MYWTGDREGPDTSIGDCLRYPNQTLPKQAQEKCGEWKNYMLPHGGHVKGTPEYP